MTRYAAEFGPHRRAGPRSRPEDKHRCGGHARAGLHVEPVVRASRPNEAWSWGITNVMRPKVAM